MKELVVVAIGGNSLIKDKTHQSVEDQYKAVCETAGHIAGLCEKGYKVVITHGNGPQVGFILRRSEVAVVLEHLHPVPLVSCGADTQGSIGYQIQQAMDNEFRARNLMSSTSSDEFQSAVTVVTQVEVDKDDPAFLNPAKPIGSFFDEKEYNKIKEEHPDWNMVSDAGRGYRRVVASPKPKNILELRAIKKLLDDDFCVIAVGGGGIPVIKAHDNRLTGVDAVIDKDFATSLLAAKLNSDLLIISTGVEKVCLNFGKPNQKDLDVITLAEAKQYIEEGHFAPGSMLPKMQAAIQFIEDGGKKSIITSPEFISKAVDGETGTHIIRG